MSTHSEKLQKLGAYREKITAIILASFANIATVDFLREHGSFKVIFDAKTPRKAKDVLNLVSLCAKVAEENAFWENWLEHIQKAITNPKEQAANTVAGTVFEIVRKGKTHLRATHALLPYVEAPTEDEVGKLFALSDHFFATDTLIQLTNDIQTALDAIHNRLSA